MSNEEIKIYKPELGVDGTIPQLLDWCYRYDSDYSDEALDYIAEQAASLGFDPSVTQLIKKQRHNEKPRRLPYEQMKLDKLVYDKIGHEETMEYGEVEVREEGDRIIIAVRGVDDNGPFTAAIIVPLDEFMRGEDNYLEERVGAALYYGKVYDE